MIHVDVKDLKNHLRQYLRMTQAGEAIGVTVRGKVIAAITGATPKAPPLLHTLQHLVDGKHYHWNGHKPRGLSQKPRLTPGPNLADLIARDRR